ncbi:two-component regulator propeller domain-containing protein [Alishewanella jeotgali]|uniref:GGDEF domain-containing protein n=1 Tax=Alishewanella jeotgali KCTC 22429 TaxID=1129374 RepID=H3ZHR1_9ALTE|nr:two-component regulator propeller domain-containing protein [Alishewanella jeotgali]EHR39917.1 hypothetical protein AJE_14595 [Alishewanella jeotgali KCTC 22429]
MRLFCGILMLIWLAPLSAYTPSVFDYDIKHWTSADGLSSNSVRAVTQDHQGYLWFGTLYGLHRFDGHQFDVFTTETHPQLASNAITRLLTDTEGRIWVGTKAGLTLLKPQKMQFERLPIFNEVTSMIELADGDVWIAADQLFQVSQGQVRRIEQIKAVVSQLERYQQKIWVVAAEMLYQRNADGDWSQYELPAELMQTPVYDVSWTQQGLMLAAESGLYRLTEMQTVVPVALPDNGKTPVYQVLEDSQGATWISAYRKLFYRYQQQEWQTVTVQELGNSPWFSELFEDRSGQLWLTSFSDGVYRAGITQIRRLQPSTESVVRSLALTPQGKLLLATQTDVGILDKDGEYQTLLTQDALLGQTVHAVYWPSSDELWFGLERGVFRLVHSRLEPVFPELLGQTVRVVQSSVLGGTWIGALQGLYYFSEAGLEYSDLNQEFESRQITALADSAAQLVIGTSRGLYRRQQQRLNRLGSGTPLYNAYILAVIILPDQTVLASTLDDGIFIQQSGQNWQQLHSGNGLLHGPAMSFYYHQYSGWIWISTSKGIFRLERASLHNAAKDGYRIEEILSPFDRQMGSLSSRCCNGAGQSKVAYWQQQLWYPTLKGVVAVPEQPAGTIMPPIQLQLKQVSSQQRYPLGNADRRLVLEQYERNLTISYTALEFSRPESLEFRYQLQGFDTDWHQVTERREAVYTNLPPGSFEFVVQAKYRHQGWHDATQTQIQLVIPRRFDETLIYRLLWLLLIISSLYGLFWLYRQNTLLKQEQLERLVRQRTQELENSNQRLNELNEELQKLTHRDSQSGLRNRRFLLEQLPKDIEHFQRNSQTLQEQGKSIALLVLQPQALEPLVQQYGKGITDSLLQQFTAVLSRETRGSDYVVRLENWQFVVVFRDITVAQVAPYSKRLVEQLSSVLIQPSTTVEKLALDVFGGYAFFPLPLLGGQLLGWESSLKLATLTAQQLMRAGQSGVGCLKFADQLDAFEFEESADLELQVLRLQAEGLIWLDVE